MKNTIQKSIIFNKAEYNKVFNSYQQIRKLDSVKDISFHKFVRLLIQLGLDNLMDDIRYKMEAGLI